MICVSPISVHGQRFNCGHCAACRINRVQVWTTRIIHELSYWDKASFVTLTYDDEHLPVGNELFPRDLTLFWKRLRKDTGRDLKYIASGEYGDRDRPHYHAIIFGVGHDESELVEDAWQNGFVYLGTANANSARYVVKYIQKKVTGKLQKAAYQGRLPPFLRCSGGIGWRWLSDNNAKVERMLYVTRHGMKIPMPKYYKERLGLTAEDYGPFLNEAKAKEARHLVALDIPQLELAIYEERKRAQVAESLRWLAENKERQGTL